MTRLISFYLSNFSFFSLSPSFLPSFSTLPPAPPRPFVFVKGWGKKLSFLKWFCFWRIKELRGAEGRLLSWVFISISLSGRKNSTALLFGTLYEPPVVSGAITPRLSSAAELRWVEGGERLPKAPVARVVFVLIDHILLLWVEIWRINYDADLTPFPFVEAVWQGMFGLLEILALLRLHPPTHPPPPPRLWTGSCCLCDHKLLWGDQDTGLVCGFRETARATLSVWVYKMTT